MDNKDKEYTVERLTVGELLSIRKTNDPIDKRRAIALEQVYFDTVIMGAIQGEAFFRALAENIDVMFEENRKRFMGYIFRDHITRYENLPGVKISVLFSYHYEDKDFDWVVVEKI